MKNFKIIISSYIRKLNGEVRPRGDIQEYIIDEDRNKKNPFIIHIALFAVTMFTTTLAGAGSGDTLLSAMASGLPYSLTLMAILLSHEFGHYFAARKFGVNASLPYFIPFPSIIGTMGAVIKTKSPIPDRRALLYIGAMGPIPGFIVSVAAVVAGISLSSVQPLPVPGGEAQIPVFGDSLLFAFLVKIIHGPIPAGYDIFLSPYAWAGWIGFLITSLNLMPIGQLDGSHVLYALIGPAQRYFGWAAFVALAGLSFIWYGWVVWIIITLVLLMVAHPPVPEGPELLWYEKTAGWLCMAILLLTFIPVPVEFL